MALHYWQIAIERAGHRADEVLGLAVQETARLPGAAPAWSQYVEAHPELLLVYAQLVPESQAGVAFQRWWKERGSTAADLNDREVANFYRLAPRWGTREQFDEWRRNHPELRARDCKIWAGLLTAWGAHAEAWQVLASEMPEPPFPATPPRFDRVHLEGVWREDESKFVNARELAQVLNAAGDRVGAQRVIVAVAARPDAPEWFIRKAAHLLAADGQQREAVAVLLAERFVPLPPPVAPAKP
jgi:hypothetical protein